MGKSGNVLKDDLITSKKKPINTRLFYLKKPGLDFLSSLRHPLLYKDCKSGWINEADLIERLASLMNQIDLDEIGIKERIRSEIERHRKFQSGILGIKEKTIKVVDIDIRNYAKYILREGTMLEKRELLICLKSKITMANNR